MTPPKFIRRWFEQFLKSRAHFGNQLRLKHKQIYVLPTPLGGLLFMTACLILVLGINYQNNLILLFAYLCFGLFITNILHGYLNLVNLSIRFLNVSDGTAGEHYSVQFQCHAARKVRMVHFHLQGGHAQKALFTQNPENITLKVPAKKRGAFNIPRITIDTLYPFGFFRVWSYVHFDAKVHVYPSPVKAALNDQTALPTDLDGEKPVHGDEDFSEIRDYQKGEPINRISWKHFARNRQLLTSEFISYQSQECVLDYQSQSGSKEHRLSVLAYHVYALERTGTPFSLRLPGQTLALGQGHHHSINALRALSEVT